MAAKANHQPLESPAIPMSQPRRKRRPTRTPKPSGTKSRLCSPSPYLDRSFHRKKLLFAACKSDDDEDTTSESESLEYDLPSDDADSEYQIANDLSALQHDDDDDDEDGEYAKDDDNDEYDYDNYDEEKSTSDVSSRGRSTTSDALIADIENLSIANDPKLARNARVSVKMSSKDKRGRPLQSVQTPQLFVKQHTKIKKKKQKQSNTESNKYDTNRSSKTSSNSDAVRDAHKKTVIRITRSSKVFSKSHIFGTLLVKPAECGSGCPLYRSSWKGQNTVTKLMPLWENAEFTKEENVDNALREFEFHADIYRKGCKSYGVKDCPVVSIIACVKLRHPVVSSQDEEQRNESPTRRYQTRGAVKRGQKMLVKKPYLAFVMPQLHCNLAQFVSRYRKLTEEEGRRLLVTGVRFLSLLETAEMVHCDIKPENIFLDVCLEEEDPVINAFVFGDFGCAAKTTEEFPYGSLTGTVTMWDLEALVGNEIWKRKWIRVKYQSENEMEYIQYMSSTNLILDIYSANNDLYGVIGSLFDGIYGGSIMEELLEEENEEWEDTDWPEYTQLIRTCRAQVMEDGFMENELEELGVTDPVLQTALIQVGRRRKHRVTLDELVDLVGH